MDFLIVSLLCFNHNLSLPVVATGMDFMTSRFLGETLRRCGSFFMKRQFGKVAYFSFLSKCKILVLCEVRLNALINGMIILLTKDKGG